MSNKVLLELLRKLRIPSSLGSSIVADKSSTDPVSSGPNVTYKKKKKRHRGSMTVEKKSLLSYFLWEDIRMDLRAIQN